MALPVKFKATVASKLKDKEMLEKIKKAKKSTPKSNNIIDIIERIRQDVETNLGQFKDHYQCITKVEDLEKYIEKANAYDEIAIDTETNGLNPLVDGIVGLCLYFPGEPATYVPINHIDYFSDERLPNQLTEEEVKRCLEKLTAKIIYHNAQFDIRVIIHQVGVRLSVWWDTLIAGQLLNENEPHGLKPLHGKYISHTDEKTFSDLFGKNFPFKYVPIEFAYLYGAHDAIDTFELKDFQQKYLENPNRPDMVALNKLYRTTEIPMIDVIVDLEDVGVAVDREYLQELHDKYTANVNEALSHCANEVVDKYSDMIKDYNAEHFDKPLDLPLNVGSATQLAILFYDILGCKPVKGKKPRSTDEDVMNVFAKDYDIAKYILNYRKATKITSTYVDNIPEILHTDGRVHTHFNSNGAKTGRMSSSDPLNLQNIPSHNEDIRKMFVGQTTVRDVEKRSDNAYILDRCEEIQLADGSWQWAELVKVGDKLSDGSIVKAVKIKELKVLIGV